MADKIYLGSGKEKTFDDGGSVISVHLKLDGMAEYFKEYGYTSASGEKRIKLNIGTRRNIGDYGETHSVVLDTWKPDGAGSNPFEGGNTDTGDFDVNGNPKPKNNDYRGANQGGNNNETDIPF
jgi:hypothetical protein